ncbi:unnamed protein product [Triticum turgidum subsp. durum]|uniref:Ankyrin repeat domain-containing protein EMB506, chloroplastic n=1 Tax=Triticum turgidum subsp. durum TaxID=4567 RepID=A0A9R1BXG5_TRITD|nr:unnamed protein product [Triticum turgidum subsp. durum]
MLPWAATASSAAAAALLHASPRPASHRAALPHYRPSPSLPPPLSIAFRAPARVLPRGGDAFWEEPDDGSGSDYEDNGKQATVQRSSPFPSPLPLSRLVARRQQEREEQELRREIELLLTPEEEAILDQNETADVTKISSPKWHPLHTYALALQIPLMDKLLDNGVDIDLVDKDGFTPLHKAIIGKKEAVISHLLRKGANPHVTDRDGATPLHYAVQVGALQTVKLLIKYRVDVNVADVDGWTPLHLAVQSRNRDITKILLVNGADQTRRTNVWPFWFNVFGSIIFASDALRSYFVYILMPLYVVLQNFDSHLEKCSYPLYNFFNLDVLSRPLFLRCISCSLL